MDHFRSSIAAEAVAALHRLVQCHPMMQGVIIKEVRDVLLIPKLPNRTKYNCICFLSAQMLSKDK